jgi:nicotinate phosphoribosyltransferase
MSPGPRITALFTDLYEVTMAQAYAAERMSGPAVFETLFRKLPDERSYVIAAGLSDVLDFFEALRFDQEDLEYLLGIGLFTEEFVQRLSEVRFTGDVWAVPEGTVVFPNEPIVQVIAPILEAQLAETFVVNQIHLQSVIASKAARIVDAARGRAVVEFRSATRSRHRRGAQGCPGELPCRRGGNIELASGPRVRNPRLRDDGPQLHSSVRQ